jgi:hypothetical protein
MSEEFEGNEDWMKREKGRIASKGAMAAERASAGLGTSHDDAGLGGMLSTRSSVWPKPPPKKDSKTSK